MYSDARFIHYRFPIFLSVYKVEKKSPFIIICVVKIVEPST